MKSKPHVPNELASNLRYIAPTPLRCTVGGVDFVFATGKVYENLPASGYLFSLWKQGFFEEVPPSGIVVESNKQLKPL